jgi:sporulation protein YlmC with PRC-barrel domain
MAEILYLTELLGLKVFDLKGRVLGRVRDAAIVPLIDPQRVDRFLIGGSGYAWLTVRHDQIERISLTGIELRDEVLTPFHNDEYMLRLVRDLLDQQIIDAQGRKVVRVTDITFNIEGPELKVLEVDVGLRSVLRRLAQGVLPRQWIRRLQEPIAPQSISWQFCNIVEPDPLRRLRLNISNDFLEKMHPADIADIVEELGPEDREAIIASLDEEVAAEALSEVDPDMQASILEALETEKAADIMDEMDPGEAADVLAELEDERADEIMHEMEAEEEVTELLEFAEDSAGRLMSTEFVALADDATVSAAVRLLKENPESIEALQAIYLTAGEELVATVPLARLLLAAGDAPLMKLAAENSARVKVDAKQSRVVELFDKYNLLELPVVNAEGHLVGVITADDVITLLRDK